jgi:formate dehydrogenase subunit gamma
VDSVPSSATVGVSLVRVLRFDAVQRAAHWANALLFGILIATALPLYFASVETLVGRRALIVDIHVWAGLMLPVPVLVSLVGPWGRRMRRDLRRINYWTRDELRWLRNLGVNAPPVVDKFNPGQKLNAIFVGGAIVVMLATGSVMHWFGAFPLSWRTGATFVHDLLSLFIVLVVVGHILFALTHRESLRSMIKGWVSEAWAARHAPAWLAEVREEEGAAADGRPVETVTSGGPAPGQEA